MDGLTTKSPGAKPATKFQQQQFDLLLSRARQMMEAAGQEWMSALQTDPVNGAVTLGTQTVRSLVKMSEEAGQKVDPSVLFNVGVQFVKDIAALVNAAGLVPDEGIAGFLKEVMQQSISAYMEEDSAEGLLTPAEKKKADGMLAQMQGGSPGEPAPPAGPMQAPEGAQPPQEPQMPEPMMEEDPTAGADDPEMAAELAALRAKRGA